MKIRTTILIGLVALFVAGNLNAQEFYYGTYGTIPVVRDSTKVLVKFDPSVPALNREAVVDSVSRISQALSTNETVDEFVVYGLESGAGYNDFLDSLQAVSVILFAEPFYLLEDSNALYIGQSFCVAFDEDLSEDQIDSINALYSVTIQRELYEMHNVFVLMNSPNSGHRTLELANIYHDLPESRYAHPNFGMRAQKMSYKLFDYYSDYQFHTKKVIGVFNSASVWDFSGLSRPLTVAVIDDGVASHEDLPSARVLGGYDFADLEDDATPGPSEAHGMGCSGIIGAEHTTDSTAGLLATSGVISLNPHTLILPVNIFGDSGNAATNDNIADAITYAYTHGAEVLSCSWGYNSSTWEYPALTDALERATIFGRDGRGCAVIFSSGNYAQAGISGVAYPANQPFCLAVGAVMLNDVRWPYSSYGTALDLVAPSGATNLQGDVWTLDQMGITGYNPNRISSCPPGSNDVDYDCKFGGTSAACPVVSGTASLLLSKDSTLSGQAVHYILRNSAVKHLDWGTITPPSTQYGYGRVDAFRAVLSISRGDINNDGQSFPDLADLVYLINYLMLGGPEPFPSVLLADVNCDGQVDLSDLNYLVDHQIFGGPPPVNPCFEFGD